MKWRINTLKIIAIKLLFITSTLLAIPNPEIGKEYQIWVDRVRLRQSPNLQGKIIANLNAGDKIKCIGIGGKRIKITLRGVLYNTRWLKVKTKDNRIGWIYNGCAAPLTHDIDKKWKAIIIYADNPQDYGEDLGYFSYIVEKSCKKVGIYFYSATKEYPVVKIGNRLYPYLCVVFTKKKQKPKSGYKYIRPKDKYPSYYFIKKEGENIKVASYPHDVPENVIKFAGSFFAINIQIIKEKEY